MRYIIIVLITTVLLFFILFYNPYLGVYSNSVTIQFDYNDPEYNWSYYVNNNNLIIKESTQNKWIFIPSNDGECIIKFYYHNDVKNKYEIYYKFKVKKNKIYWIEGEGKGLLDYPNPY